MIRTCIGVCLVGLLLLVAGCAFAAETNHEDLQTVIRRQLAEKSLPPSVMARELATRFNLPRSEVYDMILKTRRNR